MRCFIQEREVKEYLKKKFNIDVDEDTIRALYDQALKEFPNAIPHVYCVEEGRNKIYITLVGEEYTVLGGPNCILASMKIPLPTPTRCEPTPYGYALTWSDGAVTQICEDPGCSKNCQAVDSHIDYF